MTLPKITTVLPFEDFPVEADRTWVDWVHDADDPKKNHLKPEALDDILVLDVSEGHIGALFGSSILAEFGADVIRVEPPEGMPLLDADRDKIKQVLLNLLSNAVKYNRPNGTVMMRAELTEKEMVLIVQDTGLGIPDEALPHLFEKFFRVREHEGRASGTGLGLSICKQIVNGHGGRIEVKSKIGVGTVFSIFLPYANKTSPRAENGRKAAKQ